MVNILIYMYLINIASGLAINLNLYTSLILKVLASWEIATLVKTIFLNRTW